MQSEPAQNIPLFMHLTLPSAAWLSLAWCICLCRKKKKAPAYLSQLNCSEALPSRTGQMWGLDLQETTPSLSPLIPFYKSLVYRCSCFWNPISFCLLQRTFKEGHSKKEGRKLLVGVLHGQEQHVWSIMPWRVLVLCGGILPSALWANDVSSPWKWALIQQETESRKNSGRMDHHSPFPLNHSSFWPDSGSPLNVGFLFLSHGVQGIKVVSTDVFTAKLIPLSLLPSLLSMSESLQFLISHKPTPSLVIRLKHLLVSSI